MTRLPCWVQLAFATFAAAAPAGVSDRIARVLAAGDETAVSVSVTVGDVVVRGWDRGEVSVAITRRAADRQQLARIPAHIDQDAHGIRVRAVQDGEGRDPSVRADVELRVPSAAHLRDVDVFEGRVELAELRGSCSVRVERGNIVARQLGGALRLETVIGNVAIERATISPGNPTRIRTFNGGVVLELMAQPRDARILALSMGGIITSDIPLTMKQEWGPRFGETTLGSGDPLVSIDAVNGDISIRLRR